MSIDPITLKEFLEKHPPGHRVSVSDLLVQREESRSGSGPVAYSVQQKYISCPQIELYCSNDACLGMRFFSTTKDAHRINENKPTDEFLIYLCNNCGRSFKTFAVEVWPGGELAGEIFKYGEHPAFGPPIPAKVLRLIQDDKDLFLAGRRAEDQGMGIGAFVYYRRVIENQKNRIFDEIIRVINKISPGNPVIEDLQKAKEETQFTKAIGEIKHALPDSLNINGQNPLILLHWALSQGVHDHTDAECLDLATDVRIVLVEFALKLQSALKDEAELNQAISRLSQKRSQK